LLLADKQLLAVPKVSTVIGRQDFSYAAPSSGNEVPVEIRNSPSLSSLRSSLRHTDSLLPSFSATTPFYTCRRFGLSSWLRACYQCKICIIL